MIAHDAKMAALSGRHEPLGYKPRTEHPLLLASYDEPTSLHESFTSTALTIEEQQDDEAKVLDHLLLKSTAPKTHKLDTAVVDGRKKN